MSTRRISVLLLGFWIGCSLFMTFIATRNLRAADTILAQPSRPIERAVEDIGHDRVRAILRFEAAELNRAYFFYWQRAQILLGVAVFGFLYVATGANRRLLGTLIAILLLLFVQHFRVQPQIADLGRALDFVPADELTEERSAFQVYHSYYITIELVKMLLVAFVSIRMLMYGSSGKRRRRSAKPAEVDVEPVNNADHGHVDR
jgi:hypothetical protein